MLSFFSNAVNHNIPSTRIFHPPRVIYCKNNHISVWNMIFSLVRSSIINFQTNFTLSRIFQAENMYFFLHFDVFVLFSNSVDRVCQWKCRENKSKQQNGSRKKIHINYLILLFHCYCYQVSATTEKIYISSCFRQWDFV